MGAPAVLPAIIPTFTITIYTASQNYSVNQTSEIKNKLNVRLEDQEDLLHLCFE